MKHIKLHPQTVALALSGGTARAAAHIGALKVLEKNGFKPKQLAGTSAGAFLAALYALGCPASELERTIQEQSFKDLFLKTFDLGLHKAGLLAGNRFRNWLEQTYFGSARFEDTIIPLTISCTDLTTGEQVFIREGSIAEAVHASCALPLIMAPVKRESRWIIDGGFASVIPFAALDPSLDIHLGLQAGINADSSLIIKTIRRYWNSALGQLSKDLLLDMPALPAHKRLNLGIIRTLASYSQNLQVPKDALLIDLKPNINWTEFSKTSQAVEQGETIMQQALPSLNQYKTSPKKERRPNKFPSTRRNPLQQRSTRAAKRLSS
jgi:NTE family protein